MTPLVLLAIAAPQHLAVLDLDGEGITPNEKKALTELFTEEVARHFEGKVYSRHELQEMLLREERVQRLDQCTDAGCYAEIALALGAELMIEGSVTRLGESVTVTASLIDAAKSSVAARASLEWSGPPEGLADVMRAVAQRLMIPERYLAPGALLLSAETPGATLTIDGKLHGVAPVGRIAGLSLGAHALVAAADGYRPLSRPFVILHGKDTVLDVTLEAPEETPLYTKWWLWAIVGTAVTGAAAAAIIAAGRDGVDPPPSGTVDVTWRLP